jgi:hypothetical protein
MAGYPAALQAGYPSEETGGQAQAYGVACRGIRVIWRKLDCLNPNLQKVQVATPAGKTPVTGAGPYGRVIAYLP